LVPALVAAKTTQVAARTDDVGWAPITDFSVDCAGRVVSMLAGLAENQPELAHLNFVAVG
jgi:hypothetical protein